MKTSNKIFWGLFFIIGGIAFIVNELDYFYGFNLVNFLFTILLIAIILKSVFKLNFFGILIPLAMIAVINAENFGILMIQPFTMYITAVLGSIGFTILFHKPRKNSCFKRNRNNEENFGEVINDQDANVVDFNVSFGSSIKYVNSNNLEKANFSCTLGALKVYFDNSKISKNGAVIRIDTTLAGVELYIPKTWNVINSVEATLGAVEEKNRHYETNGPTVTLTGNVQLGAIDIIYI